MFHQPNCPYYQPGCTCPPVQQVQSHIQAARTHTTPSPSIVRYQSQSSCQAPPPPYSPHAAKASRQLRTGFDCVAQRLDKFGEICERRVHFDVPHRSTKRSSSLVTSGPNNSHHHERSRQHRSSSSSIRSAFVIPRPILRKQPQPEPLQPTIYIITFATDIIPNTSHNVRSLIASQVPPSDQPIPHLYTIDARGFTPPSAAQCALYSGISPLIQDIVLSDRAARKAVKTAIHNLLSFGAREREKATTGNRIGRTEVCMSVCCHAGTHRSVAIGERIAQGCKEGVERMGSRDGVRVVVRHVHRVKGSGDPF
ncbi:hypothetical protein EK21DRAFT_90416 [Setomelanomma holmii]|uniref:RapZ C-terminal domain-containing protein n=1 Tax=Setomelanomma holmii TaxID=210430 RepID=A0A9P4H6U9_9PLEO|nr:hypothetical protein EK21DRAFT_90416 [Setomelanomma holmii]